MTGDTPYDAKAAQGAGVSALGVLTGGFSLAALKNAGCYAVIKEVGEMKQFLETWERTPAVEKMPMTPLS
jgi:phosphoglycolate phosphatase-like HAD superfamily hydrolase